MTKTETYTFTLLLEGPDVTDDEVFDALFEAGCDDALFGQRDSVQYADFDREAASLAQAVGSAISQIESVPGMRVVRAEPDDLVTATVIAERTGRSRESVRLLIEGRRGPGSFPPPIAWVDAKTRLWQWTDVATWFSDALGEQLPLHQGAQFLAALNSALELRSRAPELHERDEIAAVTTIVKQDEWILATAARRRI